MVLKFNNRYNVDDLVRSIKTGEVYRISSVSVTADIYKRSSGVKSCKYIRYSAYLVGRAYIQTSFTEDELMPY